MVRTRCYRDGALVAEGFPVADVSEYLKEPDTTIWIDLFAPTATPEPARKLAAAADLDVVREELGLHDLAVEDVTDPNQRPKLDHYPEHLFMVGYSLNLDTDTGRLQAHEIDAFITSNALVTVHEDDRFDIDAVVARWDSTTSLARSGVPFLLHGLLDYIVDTHFEALQALDTEIDGLEEQLFDDVTTDTQLQRRTFDLRKSLVQFRKLVLPMREVVNTFMRRDLGIVDERLAPYFQDVYDHVLRVTEWTESLRDLLANILETRLTVRGNRLNVIMKKVTSWAAIIAVPTAITGFYGQNLPYPGYQQPWGYWTSLAIMLGASGGLYLLFKRKDWL